MTNVVGGRNPGLGVSGLRLTLGAAWRCQGVPFLIRVLFRSQILAGYSYKSSQYGLTIDTVTALNVLIR
jgi:hypothetical protein